eukprot:543455_1
MALLLTTEWMLCIVQTRVLISYIFLADIKPIVCLYISKIIACSTIYLLLFKADASQFTYPMNLLQHNSTSYIELTLTFFNYSASAQTCTGVSDTVPVGATAEFISGLQILVFGIAYNVFILSVAILRFSEGSDLEYVKKHDDNDNSQPLLQMESSSYDFFQVNQPSGATFDILNVEQYIVPQKYLKRFEFFYDNMLFICIGIELINTVVNYFACDVKDECGAGLLILSVVLDLMLLCICLLCMFLKLQMVKVVGMNINTSVIRLIYAYLTMLLLFTILYFDLWLWTKRDNGIKPAFQIEYDTNNYWVMLEHFLYYSITSFTSHGSESIVMAWAGYAQFVNGFQMLIGVFFLSVVFGIGLMNLDIQRTIATEQYIEDQLVVEAASTPRWFKAGLLTKRVSRRLELAKQQNENSNNIHLTMVGV